MSSICFSSPLHPELLVFLTLLSEASVWRDTFTLQLAEAAVLQQLFCLQAVGSPSLLVEKLLTCGGRG